MREVLYINGRRTITELTRAQMVCTPRQARLAMMATPHNGGTLLDAVGAAIAGSGDAALSIAWEYATEWQRLDPAISALGAALGLTDTQIDDLFVRAMAI